MAPLRLLAARPSLRVLALASTEPVVIPARDGELLHGYLTLTRTPRARASARQPLALVLHGGPNARDYGGFVPSTQLLAARGLHVLTLNYRGSTGYGMRFAALGNGQLRKMHYDVDDARRWAVASP